MQAPVALMARKIAPRIMRALQKEDKDTKELIQKAKDFLFSVGVRTSSERAWEIFKAMHKIPIDMLVERNEEIEYIGNGKHLTSKHEDYYLSIKYVGRFELKAVSSPTSQKSRTPTIKYKPSANVRKAIADSVKVKKDKEN